MSDLIRPAAVEHGDPLAHGASPSNEEASNPAGDKGSGGDSKRSILVDAQGRAIGTAGQDAGQTLITQEEVKQEAPAFLKNIVRRPAGWTQLTNFDGSTVEHDTQQCIHCQKHWQFIPGSGALRGFCYNCQGLLCGKPKCMRDCQHWEAAMEERERVFRILVISRG